MTNSKPIAEAFARSVSSPWRELAACRDSDTNYFFAPTYMEKGRREPKADRHTREQAAKRICDGCSVRSDCLAYALEAGEIHGIYGGLNETERHDLRNKPLALVG